MYKYVPWTVLIATTSKLLALRENSESESHALCFRYSSISHYWLSRQFESTFAGALCLGYEETCLA